ncbi:MFS transporter [Actinoallomurus rhizosphaericola]|uniref:MFS transporter n=1 Tax=Actinoallomurus rhizosphaericola TaxID=2952536 RepID=UPI0020936A03|nr:MFS transporter [Actinoallomurus rhizosphaericola]MCO5995980.1 MFS transporter [Actinoallomurus rhizosphaericola]
MTNETTVTASPRADLPPTTDGDRTVRFRRPAAALALSLAGGLAGAPVLLVSARAAQGLGGALLFPATLTLVSTGFAEGRERNRAFAVWGTAGGSGMILGSLLGGVLTDAFGWAVVFFVNVPLAGVAALLALPLVPRGTVRRTGRRFDLAGALTATGGITLVVFALVQGRESGWGAPAVVAAALLGAALLALFGVIEVRSADPLLPPALLPGVVALGFTPAHRRTAPADARRHAAA